MRGENGNLKNVSLKSGCRVFQELLKCPNLCWSKRINIPRHWETLIKAGYSSVVEHLPSTARPWVHNPAL